MAWGVWNRKPTDAVTATVGLDLNSSRARAVSGPPWGAAPRVLPLADVHADLPLQVSLEHRTPVVGWPGYHLVRQAPHLICRDYLPSLGERGASRVTESALAATIAALKRELPPGHAAGLAIPAYFGDMQARQLIDALVHVGANIAGSVAAPLALAATESAAFGTALVLDADEHALSWSVLVAEGPQARLLAHHGLRAASVRAWFDRLIDAVADRCIRLCRRDPRDSAAAEQGIFEQLDTALSALLTNPQVILNIRTAHWYQELKLTADEFESFCAPLAQLGVESMRQVATEAHSVAPVMARPDLLWVTADAARLPGLVAAATQHVPESTTVQILAPDGLAIAAHTLAGHWLRGDLPRGHTGPVVLRLGMKSERHDAGRSRSQRI